MRSTIPFVVLLRASLALAAPTAFRRDQTGPAPVAQATCSQEIQDQSSHVHGAVQLCLRMRLSDLSTGPLTPSAIELIECHRDDSVIVPSAKSTSSHGTHGSPPSPVNAEEDRPKNGGNKSSDSPKPNNKPTDNNDHHNKTSDDTNRESKAVKGPPTHSNTEGSKHSASSRHPEPTSSVTHSAPARPSESPAGPKGKGDVKPAASTHNPAMNQPTSGNESHPHGTGSGSDKGSNSNSDTGDDGTGIPRINLDRLQPLVEVKANVKAFDGLKNGTGGKHTVEDANVSNPTSDLPSVDKIADVNASVIKNPGPSDVLGDGQAKAADLKKTATSKIVPQEVSHSSKMESAGQSASDSSNAASHRPAAALEASPVHDASRVDFHASAAKAGVVRMV